MMDTIIEILQKMAATCPNKEICGVVDTSFVIHKITNVATTSKSCFIFSKKEYFTLINKLREEGKQVLFIYHSHPSGKVTPSKADLAFTKRSGIPQVIITHNAFTVVDNG